MKEIIVEKLREVEEKENIKIIHAIESGSRAWGFASPDSDYDVRFIYVRPLDYYLKLEKTRDVIEWQLDETLDINGWDLQKALRLLYKSNPTIFEWNNSPIIYKTIPEWQIVREIIDDCFQSKSGLYHYISTAKRNYKEFLTTEMVKFKKYFYVIRPILACKWILDKQCPPPMLFSELCNAELEPQIKPLIDNLLDIKMRTPETGEGKRIDKLNEYIENSMQDIQLIMEKLDSEESCDWGKLDKVFNSIVKNSGL